MPSPGRTTMSARMLQLLVAGDVGMLLQQVAELVGTLEQAGLGEGIQRERVAAAVGQAHAACGHIDVQLEAGMRNQLVDDGLVEHDRQQAVLERSEEQTSEEHTSELQSLMRISYAVFCLKKKKH